MESRYRFLIGLIVQKSYQYASGPHYFPYYLVVRALVSSAGILIFFFIKSEPRETEF